MYTYMCSQSDKVSYGGLCVFVQTYLFYFDCENKLSAYINRTRCLLPGDLTRAVSVETSQRQNSLITGFELPFVCVLSVKFSRGCCQSSVAIFLVNMITTNKSRQMKLLQGQIESQYV